MMADHVHMLIKMPPKYAVSEVVGYLKGKSAIAVARQFGQGHLILLFYEASNYEASNRIAKRWKLTTKEVFKYDC